MPTPAEPIGQPLTGHTDRVKSVAFSPDGTRIASGSWDDTVRLWDAAHRQTDRPAAQGPHGPGVAAWRSARTGSGSFPPAVGRHGAGVGRGHRQADRSAAQPATNNLVSERGVQPGRAGGWPPAARQDGAGVGRRHRASRSASRSPATNDSVWSVAFSPDGQRLVSGSADKTVRVWDADTGKPVGRPLAGHTDDVMSVAFSPDGERIVSGSWDKTVRVWDADTGEPFGQPLTGHTDRVNSVAFSPDGTRIVSGSTDNTVRLWDADSGQPIGQPLTGHYGRGVQRGVQPGRATDRLGQRRQHGAACGTPTPANRSARRCTSHSGAVDSVAFSPDGRRIVSGSYDGTVQVWDAATGQPVGAPLAGHTGSVVSVAFSPDGRRIASGSLDNTVRAVGRGHRPAHRCAADRPHRLGEQCGV